MADELILSGEAAMRILLITNHFHPEPNRLKGLAFVRELQRRGHKVQVLTGFPNYPGGKIYPGYRMRWVFEENVEGITITRVASYPSHDASAIRRIATYVSIALAMVAHVLRLRGRFDVCHVYLGPLTLMWPARLLRWWTGCPIVADVQDLWPESVLESGMLRPRWLGAFLNAWCRRLYRSADGLIALSPGCRSALVDAGVPASKIEVIYNWCDPASVAASDGGVPSVAEKRPGFQVLYAGNMGRLQGIDTILDAAKLLAAEPEPVEVTLIGGGVECERLKRRVKDEQIGNVRMLGQMPLEDASGFQRRADLLLVHLAPSRLSSTAIPSKVQSCLSSGRPVLVAAEGESAALVQRSGGGVTCAPSDPVAMAAAIRGVAAMPIAARADLGRKARVFFDRELSFDHGLERVEAALQETGRGARRKPVVARIVFGPARAFRACATAAARAFGRNDATRAGSGAEPIAARGTTSNDGGSAEMNLKRIAVIGAGGFAREVKWLIQEINAQKPTFEFVGYVVSDLNRVGEHDSTGEIVGDMEWLRQNRSRIDAVAIGIGTPGARLKVSRELAADFSPEYWPPLIHPSARYDRATCDIGHGVILGAGSIATVNVRFEPFCTVNLACTIGHEAVIRRGSVLNPTVNISGGVDVGEGVLVGTGAQVLQYLSVGNGATVGGGAVVTKDVPPGVTVVGMPAKPLARQPKDAVSVTTTLLQQAAGTPALPERSSERRAPAEIEVGVFRSITTATAGDELLKPRSGRNGGAREGDK